MKQLSNKDTGEIVRFKKLSDDFKVQYVYYENGELLENDTFPKLGLTEQSIDFTLVPQHKLCYNDLVEYLILSRLQEIFPDYDQEDISDNWLYPQRTIRVMIPNFLVTKSSNATDLTDADYILGKLIDYVKNNINKKYRIPGTHFSIIYFEELINIDVNGVIVNPRDILVNYPEIIINEP